MIRPPIEDEVYVCPACRTAVADTGDAYACRACGRRYPVLFGIPDFRLRPDLYLSLEEERSKAARLEAFGRTSDFAGLVQHYYAITDDVPTSLAPLFAAYVMDAPARLTPVFGRLGTDPARGRLLDLGCGSGGGLIAGEPLYAELTGVDIALRWLVIARKRLLEAGVQARLVCADAEALPFAQGRYSHVLANDLIDNVRSPQAAIDGTAAALAPGGRLWLSAANRRWIGPHPATGIWAAGLLPARFRAAVLRRRHGYDPLRAVVLGTPSSLRRLAARAGLQLLDARPRTIDPALMHGRSVGVRRIAAVYAGVARLPVVRRLLTIAGPAFELLFVNPSHRRKERR